MVLSQCIWDSRTHPPTFRKPWLSVLVLYFVIHLRQRRSRLLPYFAFFASKTFLLPPLRQQGQTAEVVKALRQQPREASSRPLYACQQSSGVSENGACECIVFLQFFSLPKSLESFWKLRSPESTSVLIKRRGFSSPLSKETNFPLAPSSYFLLSAISKVIPAVGMQGFFFRKGHWKFVRKLASQALERKAIEHFWKYPFLALSGRVGQELSLEEGQKKSRKFGLGAITRTLRKLRSLISTSLPRTRGHLWAVAKFGTLKPPEAAHIMPVQPGVGKPQDVLCTSWRHAQICTCGEGKAEDMCQYFSLPVLLLWLAVDLSVCVLPRLCVRITSLSLLLLNVRLLVCVRASVTSLCVNAACVCYFSLSLFLSLCVLLLDECVISLSVWFGLEINRLFGERDFSDTRDSLAKVSWSSSTCPAALPLQALRPPTRPWRRTPPRVDRLHFATSHWHWWRLSESASVPKARPGRPSQGNTTP